MSQTQNTFFIWLISQNIRQGELINKYRKYVTPAVEQIEIDWNKNPETGEVSNIKYPMRACNQSDFGEDEYGRQIFSTWKGYLILCADMENDSKYRMRGDPADLTKENWKFVVDKCSSDDCATSEEMD